MFEESAVAVDDKANEHEQNMPKTKYAQDNTNTTALTRTAQFD